nr:alanine dehydrogenase [bacterium]
ENVLHYCVANMPGAVPFTSTQALTNATMPYAIKIANLGAEQAALKHRSIFDGVNIYKGQITYHAVAEAFGIDYTPLGDLLS